MATIQLKRKKEFQSSVRDYQVFIDNNKIGTIRNNETKNFTISPGNHNMVIKIDWCSSPIFTFDIADGETINLQVEGEMHKGWLFKILCFIVLVEVIYVGVSDSEFTRILFVPVSFIPIFLHMIYYFTLGRNKYLTISNVK